MPTVSLEVGQYYVTNEQKILRMDREANDQLTSHLGSCYYKDGRRFGRFTESDKEDIAYGLGTPEYPIDLEDFDQTLTKDYLTILRAFPYHQAIGHPPVEDGTKKDETIPDNGIPIIRFHSQDLLRMQELIHDLELVANCSGLAVDVTFTALESEG